MRRARYILLLATIYFVSSLFSIGIVAQEGIIINGFIYFYSPTCSSCAEVAKVIEKVKKENKKFKNYYKYGITKTITITCIS